MFAHRIIPKRILVISSSFIQNHRSGSNYRKSVNFFIRKNLLLTNSLTSGLFMFIGDLIQQEIEYQNKLIAKRYDWGRSGRMFMVGGMMGPAHHYYYVYLDKILPNYDAKTVMTKVLCDQTIASPLTLLGFFYSMGLLEGKTVSQCNTEISEKFKYVYMGDCLYWPPIQVINFYYLPTHYRVVYINFATMLFNIFMSYMKHYDQH